MSKIQQYCQKRYKNFISKKENWWGRGRFHFCKDWKREEQRVVIRENLNIAHRFVGNFLLGKLELQQVGRVVFFFFIIKMCNAEILVL